MPKSDLWDLTNRPYTQLKLQILKEYLPAWASILFNTAAKNKDWAKYQEIYYIDCFAGRGKYHKDGKENCIDGSPLIALQCAELFQKNPKYEGIKMNCLFIERNKKVSRDLERFCEPYKGKVDFKIYKEKDFNNVIPGIVDKTDRHPAFFFIDPDGIKGIKKGNLEKIVNRNGPTDILLNYIKGGVERIAGLAKKQISIGEFSEKDIKTIKTLADFYGLKALMANLDKTEKERLEEWIKSILEGSQLKEMAVFGMPYLHKSDNIYYLLFASRKLVAKKIILSIFKKAKSKTYKEQMRLDIFNEEEFEI